MAVWRSALLQNKEEGEVTKEGSIKKRNKKKNPFCSRYFVIALLKSEKKQYVVEISQPQKSNKNIRGKKGVFLTSMSVDER